MAVPSGEKVHMHGEAPLLCQGLEKILQQIEIKIPDALSPFEWSLIDEIGASREVDHDSCQSFVERGIEKSVTGDSHTGPKCGVQKRSQKKSGVFNGMVPIDLQISFRLQAEIDQPVTANLLDKMVKKRHSGGDFGLSGSIEIDGSVDPGLFRVPGKGGCPGKTRVREVWSVQFIGFHD
jgi:hypothetical protein